MLSNAFKGFPSVTFDRGCFLGGRKNGFLSTAAIKQQWWLNNLKILTIVCYCRSYCFDLLVVLVCFQVEG